MKSENLLVVIGLGYVGLPLALALAKRFPDVMGFDTNYCRINELRSGVDSTKEVEKHILDQTSLQLTDSLEALQDRNFFIVCVPTPVDKNHQPNLTPLIKASQTIGKVIKPGSVVVYESTVYPGVTEEICGPTIAQISGLQQGIDFKLGYSPERINPGDKLHTLEEITKVVSGEDDATLDRVAAVYSQIIAAGIHRAPSIRVAEMAKVIENTQRDLNIAFVNELALICDRMDIRTHEVLQAARTKWNFLPFSPGLVGGHCIGVDPYYLTAKAETLGYHPEVILAGRRINDNMGIYLAQRLVKLLIQAKIPIQGSRIGILGITFKENVPDLRNSRIPDIVQELRSFGIEPLIHDPLADAQEAQREYEIQLVEWGVLSNLDGLVLAVNHSFYLDLPVEELLGCLVPNGVIMDVKSMLNPVNIPKTNTYWSL